MFHWFPIGFRITLNITSIGRNYNNVGIFTWRVSDCEELVGVNQTSNNHPLNSLKPLSKRILLNEFESSEGQNKILLFGKIV